MKFVVPENHTHEYNAGGEDGFKPLSVRQEVVNHNNRDVVTQVFAVQPEPNDLGYLMSGGSIEFSVMVPVMVGVSVRTVALPDHNDGASAQEFESLKNLHGLLADLHGFYAGICDELQGVFDGTRKREKIDASIVIDQELIDASVERLKVYGCTLGHIEYLLGLSPEEAPSDEKPTLN